MRISRGSYGKVNGGGFTLVELLVVIALIGIIAAIAMPQMLPALVFSSHEGAARHLSSYGRSAISQAGLMHQDIIVKIDLDNQEYWCERMVMPESDEEGGYPGEEDDGPMESLDLLLLARSAQGPDAAEEDLKALDKEARRIHKAFEEMARRNLWARAKRVVHDRQGILDDASPLFERHFSLDADSAEPKPEELSTLLLERTRLPDGVTIESVRIGEERHSRGTIDIEISPLGLSEMVTFVVLSEEDDVIEVDWDPITAGGRIRYE